MGYEVLLMEHGFFETRKAWLEIKEERDSSTGVFAYLTKVFGTHISENKKELIRYIGRQANTDHPLEIGGIDLFESSIYQNPIKHDCEALLKQIVQNFENSEIRKDFRITFKRKQEDKKGNYILGKYKKSCNIIIDKFLEVQDAEIDERLKKACLFMAKALENKTASLEWDNNHPKKRKKYGEVLADYFTLRDEQMAKNLLWHIETFYPDKKIIVSASTYHISRNLNQVSPKPYFLGKDAVPMGTFVWDKYKDHIYSIAFISHHGEIGTIKNPTDVLYSRIPPRKKKSVEGMLHSLGYKYGFLNLRGNQKAVDAVNGVCMPPTYNKPIRAEWSTIYDGLFFIDEMHTDDWYYLEGRDKIKQPY